MHVKFRWTSLFIWLAVSVIAALSCTLSRPAAHVGETYFPIGNDSFYHAVRILETVRDPASFYEFDPKIHAPEGSLLVWPWGYDYVVAKVVSAALAIGLGTDPLMILLWAPVAAVFVGTGMLILVARRLGLGDWATALAALCMALSASTQLLYSFGQIDHHYAEHLCLLASLAAGLTWFRTPNLVSGIALGVTFALALAVHNALFILQAPFVATALLLWLQGRQASMRPVLAFIGALLGTSVAVLLPSQPFQEGRFEFYLLSWFHFYIVCCTALVIVLLARLQPTRRNMGVMLLVAVVLVVPLLNQISYARSFVDGSLGMLDQILEMRSPLQMVRDGELEPLAEFYSLLAAVAPITFGICAFRAWRERTEYRLLFWLWCMFGMALMTTQVRMHYFGVFALFMPWLILAQEIAEKSPEWRKRAWLITSLLLVLAYAPVIRHGLSEPTPRGGERFFTPLYPVFEPLRKACAEDPGVVLADTNAGHYIRFFTDCSVIANNFLLTAQQFEKADEVSRLFALPADQLTKQAPFVKYVLTRAGDIKPKGDRKFDYAFFGRHDPGLSSTLLLRPVSTLPAEYRLLYEVTMDMKQSNSEQTKTVPYAKLYKIVPPAASAPGHVGE
jgi:hypothetical protein